MTDIKDQGLYIQITSDLHLEFYEGAAPDLMEILTPSAPILALLGDIHCPGEPAKEERYKRFLHQCCEHFDHVLVLMGNHEFWAPSRDKFGNDIRQSAEDIRDIMRRLCSSHDKLHFLDDSVITIEGVRIIGSVLWSAVPQSQTVQGAQAGGGNPTETVEYRMNDFRKIFVRGESELKGSEVSTESNLQPKDTSAPQQLFKLQELQVSHTNAWHEASVKFIEQELQQATTEKKNALVLTHHAPSFYGTNDPKHPVLENGISTAFATDLEYLMSARLPVRRKSKLQQRKSLIQATVANPFASLHTWCFGHTHWCCDMSVGGVRVVGNQRGYKHEVSPGYRKDLVVFVPKEWTEPPLNPASSKCAIS